MNEWLALSLMTFASWLLIYLSRGGLRREMLWASLFTMPFGLTEPLFVPAYWNPPSLFDLTQNTGFDIEALIFCFSVGGIASVIYEVFFPVRHHKTKARNWLHVLAIISPLAFFVPSYLLTKYNPIYPAAFSMLLGGLLTLAFRPDLARKMIVSALIFTSFYFLVFQLFDIAFPGAVYRIWNMPALSGIMVYGVPAEELMFASTFGLMWSSVYENFMDRKITQSSGQKV